MSKLFERLILGIDFLFNTLYIEEIFIHTFKQLSMKININAVHFTADGKLKDHISEKLSKLVKFYDKLLGVEVFLKLENSGQVRDKIEELEAKLPGKTIFASATEKTFESSLDAAHEIIVRQLKRSKEKFKQAS